MSFKTIFGKANIFSFTVKTILGKSYMVFPNTVSISNKKKQIKDVEILKPTIKSVVS